MKAPRTTSSSLSATPRLPGPADNDLHVSLGEQSLLLRFPVRSSGMQRLLGLIPPELNGRDDITFDMLRDSVEPLLATHVTEVNWFSTYRVHHRVAENFRRRPRLYSRRRRPHP